MQPCLLLQTKRRVQLEVGSTHLCESRRLTLHAQERCCCFCLVRSNKYNKELGVQLKIKVAPTFLLFRDGDKVRQ